MHSGLNREVAQVHVSRCHADQTQIVFTVAQDERIIARSSDLEHARRRIDAIVGHVKQHGIDICARHIVEHKDSARAGAIQHNDLIEPCTACHKFTGVGEDHIFANTAWPRVGLIGACQVKIGIRRVITAADKTAEQKKGKGETEVPSQTFTNWGWDSGKRPLSREMMVWEAVAVKKTGTGPADSDGVAVIA